MAEFDDIDEMLESTFKATTNGNDEHSDGVDKSTERESKKKRSRSRSGSKSRSRKKRSRSRSRDKSRKHRSKSRSRSRDKKSRRSRSKDRKRRSRSKDRHRRSRSRSRTRRHRSKERRRSRERRRSPSPFRFRGSYRRGFSPNREYRIDPKTGVMSLPGGRGAGVDNLTPEERDARTVFCMQLSQRVRPRDLEEFFSSVGKVRDVKLITDTKTRRSKGIAYVEFYDVEAVPLAMALAGEKLMGVPIIVQHTQAEKNRAAQASNPVVQTQRQTGPMKLYVGSLHFNITEAMLRGIFEPFGAIDNIVLITDQETGRSKGYGFVTFRNPDDAKKALEQLNGFELAGRAMRVGHVTDRNENFHHHQQGSQLDSDVVDRTGIDLGATGRLQLMAKLAEGTGLEIPAAAATALTMSQQITAPPIATQCFLISNMFDPVQAAASGDPNWDAEIRDDIIEECNKHGGVLHVFVDKQSPQGNVYVKCPSVAIATTCVNALHGRWFAGRIITVAYVPVVHYHQLFPDVAALTNQFLETRRSAVGGLIPGGVFPS